jgi:S-adenosylmethionine hydrolase
MAIIGLLTDFGLQDEYVGLMKAVILGINPAATLVDISHAVDAQDLVQAAFLLEASYRYFPPGSIHLVVVDPGVGTMRPLLYVEADGYRFLAPDNGVLSLIMDPPRAATVRRLDNPRLRRSPLSATFHGRDILAPAAAYLSKGIGACELGPEAAPSAMTVLADLRAKRLADGRIAGRVVHIDRFGNLVTNIAADLLRSTEALPITIRLAGQAISGLRRTYADEAAGQPVALVGSRGYLEIAVNRGSAQRYFGVRPGDAVEVRPGG